MKYIITFNITGFYTKLDVLLASKLSRHTNILTRASNLIEELYSKAEIENEQQNRNALRKFFTKKMELPSKFSEQIAFNTRPKIEEHMLTVMDKSTHEENVSQSLPPINKQYEIAVTLLTG